MNRLSAARLDALLEEATVDAYDEDEQLTGLFTVIEENLAVPFETSVLGVDVVVESIELADAGCVVAVCVREGIRQNLPLLDLPLPSPPPEGAEWIEAYRHWAC